MHSVRYTRTYPSVTRTYPSVTRGPIRSLHADLSVRYADLSVRYTRTYPSDTRTYPSVTRGPIRFARGVPRDTRHADGSQSVPGLRPVRLYGRSAVVTLYSSTRPVRRRDCVTNIAAGEWRYYTSTRSRIGRRTSLRLSRARRASSQSRLSSALQGAERTRITVHSHHSLRLPSTFAPLLPYWNNSSSTRSHPLAVTCSRVQHREGG